MCSSSPNHRASAHLATGFDGSRKFYTVRMVRSKQEGVVIGEGWGVGVQQLMQQLPVECFSLHNDLLTLLLCARMYFLQCSFNSQSPGSCAQGASVLTAVAACRKRAWGQEMPDGVKCWELDYLYLSGSRSSLLHFHAWACLNLEWTKKPWRHAWRESFVSHASKSLRRS